MQFLLKGRIFLVLLLAFCTISVLWGQAFSEQRIREIHEHLVTIDSHTDTPLRMSREGFDIAQRHDARKDYSKLDFPRMKEGGLDGAFFAVFVSQGPRNENGYEKVKEKALELFDTIDAALRRNPDLAALAVNPEDIRRLEKEDRRAILIGVENGYAIGKDLSLISTYYLRGARYITLCHTKNNEICDSSNDSTEHGGLSEFGKKVVTEMNQVGMMIDISHISDQAVEDVLEITKAPVIASHSCARGVCDNPRNLTDNLLKRVAKNGGVVQMCILSDYVKTPLPNPVRDSARAALRKKYNGFEGLTDEQMKEATKEWYAVNALYPAVLATVSDVADHIDHMVKVAGIRHVGIGTDFDGGGGVEGCFDAGEMVNISAELLRRGYSRRELEKIWGGNLMRVMSRCDRVAARYKKSCNCDG